MSETKAVAVVKENPPLKLERGEPSFADKLALADTLLKSGFLPKAVTTPAQALAIILTGQEMGLGPMQSLRSIGVINGRPVVAADLQLALFHRAGGVSKWVSLTDAEAKLWLKHPNGVEHTESFTMDDATRAGLVRKGGTYELYPKAMLRSRCITAGLKSAGFEATAGLYDPEELGAVIPTADELSQVPEKLAQKEPMPWDGKPEGQAAQPDTSPKDGSKGTGPVWPFGTAKGTPLKDMSSDTLMANRAWAMKKDAVKFAALIEQVEEELASRQGE